MLPYLLLLIAASVPSGHAQEPAIDAEAPAVEPEESIWSFIEAADGAPPSPEQLEATRELVEERAAELSDAGAVGGTPPLEYYFDPIGVTDADPLHLDRVDPSEFDIPIVINDDVKKWMQYFLGRGRKYYARYLERSTHWVPMMHRALEARGLPKDLIYLSMIESGFSTGATSYASAAGLWQFMTYTGRDYGLRIDWWVDERRDPEKSTDAALRYLADLSKMFNGDWLLAWASYNGGQGRVMKATRYYGTTDFWKIAAGDYLHTETENYVPKLIAAAIIGKHPERYGFVGVRYQPEWKFDAVEVPASTSVEVLARCAGMTEDAFLTMNPALRRFALPPEPATQRIRITAGKAAAFKEAFAKVPPEERLTIQQHTVKRGESLGSIARKYSVSVEEIAKVNRIRNVNSIAVGTVLVIPMNGKAVSPADVEASSKPEAPAKTESASKSTSTSPKPTATVTTPATLHSVRSGDTLSGIASKYGTTVSNLQSWNKLKGTTIMVGQKLVVKPGSTAPAPATASASGSTSRSTSTASSTKSTSGASSTSAKPDTSKSVTYTVRRGDTLSAIADRYNCTVAQLQSWNGLKGTTIYVGQKLKIKS